MALVGSAWCAPVAAQTPASASTEIYDFAGFGDEALLNLFYNALQDGRNYPSAAEFQAAGIQAGDIAFVRSHMRKRPILDRADRIVAKTYETRNLWMNIPMGVGSGGDAGYPSDAFHSDVFSMWNYTNVFGSWNHSIFQAPGSWVDAAHKNGTDIYSGIKFFDTTGNPGGVGAGGWMGVITQKNADGSFKYVKPLINCLMFFGSDGINYNFEAAGYSDPDVIAFHKALYQEAAAQGFDNFHIGMYTAYSGLNNGVVDALYGTSATGKTTDLMLNYAGGDFSYSIGSSVNLAEQMMGTADGLYTGVWIVDMNRRWTALDETDAAHRCGVCLWGEHGQSRFMSYNAGNGEYEIQDNYQYLLERAFSGGNRNPLNRPAVSNSGNNWEREGTKLPLSTFCGLAEFIPERSTIQGDLPFATHFNLGNGDRYLYKGKKTAGTWYNMGNQDMVPTYRWLVVEPGTLNAATNLAPEFTHADAYTGGSSLLLKGTATMSGTDVVLYKTQLTVSSTAPVAKVATKSGVEGTEGLSVILRKADGTWIETAVPATRGASWQEDTLAIEGLATGDVIERIGLRVKGEGDFSLMVGKLEISDDFRSTPAEVKDFTVEVKEETPKTLSIKAYWDVVAGAITRASHGLVYNDEANIDHFEVLYKNGEDGRVSEIARTTQWAAYVGNIEMGEDEQPFIGVRAAATDLKTYSEIQWVAVQRADPSTLPVLEEVDTYGVTALDPNTENPHVARAVRYLTDVTTTGADQDLDYHASAPVADGTQYCNARNHVLKVHQGQTVTMFIKAKNGLDADVAAYRTSVGNSDGLQYCFGGAWMDFNGSGTFDHPLGTEPWDQDPSEGSDPEGERLFKIGNLRAAYPQIETTGCTFTFTVPEDAHTGKSRLRMVFTDAWFVGTFLPTGYTTKGFSIDFDVEITGDNPNQRGFVDTHDQGTADEPDVTAPVKEPEPEPVDAIQLAKGKAGFSRADVRDGRILFTDVEKAWVYTADGRLVKFAAGNPAAVSTQGYAPGAYIVKMQYNNVVRTQKVIVK